MTTVEDMRAKYTATLTVVKPFDPFAKTPDPLSTPTGSYGATLRKITSEAKTAIELKVFEELKIIMEKTAREGKSQTGVKLVDLNNGEECTVDGLIKLLAKHEISAKVASGVLIVSWL